jgi:hypoxanthine phosphoribosyltransferase
MFKKDDKTYYTWRDYETDIHQIRDFEFDHVVGIYRGSLPMAVHISNVFDVPMSIVGFQKRNNREPYMIKAEAPSLERILIVDDIYDTGQTMKRVIQYLAHYSADKIQAFCLFGKENNFNVSYANEHDGSWIVFPWEFMEVPLRMPDHVEDFAKLVEDESV